MLQQEYHVCQADIYCTGNKMYSGYQLLLATGQRLSQLSVCMLSLLLLCHVMGYRIRSEPCCHAIHMYTRAYDIASLPTNVNLIIILIYRFSS